MTIFIIILNYRNYQDTISVIHQLKRQKKASLEIIVVDNLSPNESFGVLKRKYAQDKHVTVLNSGKNGGYSYGNNYGLKFIRQFSPEYVVIMNNDIVIPDILLIYNLVQEIKKYPDAYLCSPNMLIDGLEQNNNAWKIPTIWGDIKRATKLGTIMLKDPVIYHFTNKKKTEKVECVPGSFFIAKYKKLESLGFFDEDIFHFGEETVLGYKIKQRGGINLLCRQYSFEHLLSNSRFIEFDKIERVKLQLKGREIFHKKYAHTHNLLTLFLIMLH